MATAKDVAQYILEELGATNTIKLQKLVYYCQAWHLVWSDQPIFNDRIEAWANGPVTPTLFYAHQGHFSIGPVFKIGDSDMLTPDEKDSIDVVLRDYGHRSSQWLVELTHLEDPWKNARRGHGPGERCSEEISLSAMHEYYSGL